MPDKGGKPYHASSISATSFFLSSSSIFLLSIGMQVVFAYFCVSRSRSIRTNSVPAQAVLAHDRRRDALLSYAAAIGAVPAVAASSCTATTTTTVAVAG